MVEKMPSLSRVNLLAKVGTVLAMFVLAVPVPSFAEEKPTTPPATTKPKKAEKGHKISAARETAILDFVKTNHAELIPLLEGIKEKAPAEYAAAMIDLDRTLTRLEKIKDAMPARYEAQLVDWKMTSRIRLLTARLAFSNDPDAVETELRAAVRERLEKRLTAQRAEREQALHRVEKLNSSINDLSTNMDSLIDKEVTQLKAARPALQAKVPKKAKPSAAVETPEAKLGEKPETKPEVKPEAKLEAKPDAKLEAKPETNGEKK